MLKALKPLSTAVLAAAMYVVAACAHADPTTEDRVVRTADRFYKLTYASGHTETFVYQFTAKVHGVMETKGDSAHGLDPFDHRECAWNVSSKFYKDGFYIVGGHIRAPVDHTDLPSVGGSGNDSGNGAMGHQTCGDTRPKAAYNAKMSEVGNYISNVFDLFLKNDGYGATIEQLKTEHPGAKVKYLGDKLIDE